jgi:hypothetical protein
MTPMMTVIRGEADRMVTERERPILRKLMKSRFLAKPGEAIPATKNTSSPRTSISERGVVAKAIGP